MEISRKTTVYCRQAGRYDQKLVDIVTGELLDRCLRPRPSPGDRVLVKPNLLVSAKPDAAVCTHPLVVASVCRYLADHGAVITVSDSPAIGAAEKIWEKCGFKEACAGIPLSVKNFSAPVKVDIGPPFGRIDIARQAIETDIVINLPKIKTHTQMLLTLAVKNMFGCIVGFEKPRWHVRCGIDRDIFATLLAGICRAVAPCATVADGIIAMHKNGPGKSGEPFDLGILLASADPFAADIAICKILGIDPRIVATCRISIDQGLVPNEIEINGSWPEVSGFILPKTGSLTFGPSFMQGFIRKHLVARPVADPGLCVGCGECEGYCPASAIRMENKKPEFDYEKCIRCYCCIEVCPAGALSTGYSLAGKLISYLWH